MSDLTPEMLLAGYAEGIFPMAEHREDDAVFWVNPQMRGVFPLELFHVSRSLAKRMRSGQFTVTTDHAFAQVVSGCADRAETWISGTILDLYCELFRLKHAHSIEVWEGAELVGGVYGVTLGAAFFGESMFSRRTDASKVALAYLVDRLKAGGFILFDAQFQTAHLRSLGAIEISRAAYRRQQAAALETSADFHRQGPIPSAQGVIQRSTQTS